MKESEGRLTELCSLGTTEQHPAVAQTLSQGAGNEGADMNKEDYVRAMKALGSRPIAVHPAYIRLTNSLECGVLLSQVVYWSLAVGREFWKTDDDIRAETLLTIRELRRAKSMIRSVPGVRVTVKGVPARTYYDVDFAELLQAIGRSVPPCSNNGVQAVGSDAVRAITENTAETTTETTTDSMLVLEPEREQPDEPMRNEHRRVEENTPIQPRSTSAPSAERSKLTSAAIVGVQKRAQAQGAMLAYGQVGKALKPLAGKGATEIVNAFEKYLANLIAENLAKGRKKLAYLSVPHFVTTYGSWIEEEPQQTMRMF